MSRHETEATFTDMGREFCVVAVSATDPVLGLALVTGVQHDGNGRTIRVVRYSDITVQRRGVS